MVWIDRSPVNNVFVLQNVLYHANTYEYDKTHTNIHEYITLCYADYITILLGYSRQLYCATKRTQSSLCSEYVFRKNDNRHHSRVSLRGFVCVNICDNRRSAASLYYHDKVYVDCECTCIKYTHRIRLHCKWLGVILFALACKSCFIDACPPSHAPPSTQHDIFTACGLAHLKSCRRAVHCIVVCPTRSWLPNRYLGK